MKSSPVLLNVRWVSDLRNSTQGRDKSETIQLSLEPLQHGPHSSLLAPACVTWEEEALGAGRSVDMTDRSIFLSA